MSNQLSKNQRNKVSRRANYRCEYCRLREEDTFFTFQVDHIISQKHGGSNELENLAYACPQCNQHKGTDLATYLDDQLNLIPFFNPRQQNWFHHFEGVHGEIIPKSDIGRATAKILQFNNPERVIIRGILQEIGLFP